ncbi:uracil-DNA glycosylase, partial [Magnetococcales bacterium HHB-1]
AQGEPFVGAAGQLLDKMIASIGFSRSEIHIANVVKCRPPGNRNPEEDETSLCQTFLFRQLEILAPKAIFAMGKFAITCLMGGGEIGPVGRARKKQFIWRGVPVIATYHPAYYLRQPIQKRFAWEDLLKLKALLDQENQSPTKGSVG